MDLKSWHDLCHHGSLLLYESAVIWNERNWVCECGSQYMMYFGLRISRTQKDDQFVGFENQLEAKGRISLLEPA